MNLRSSESSPQIAPLDETIKEMCLLPVVPGGGPLSLAKSLQEGVDQPLEVLLPAELVKMPDDSNAKLRITKNDHVAGEHVVCSTTKHLA